MSGSIGVAGSSSAASGGSATAPGIDTGWLGLGEVGERCQRALEGSVADETELVWLELAHHQVANRALRRPEVAPPPRERTLLVRVIEGGRLGQHRTLQRVDFGAAGDPGLALRRLDDAIREALAQARVNPRLGAAFHFPAPEPAESTLEPALADPELERPDVDAMVARLRGWGARQELLVANTLVGRIGIWNSRGMARRQTFTAISLTVSCGRSLGAGRAGASARTLASLTPEALVAAARAVDPGQVATVGDLPADGPVLLAPQVAVAVLEAANVAMFSARAYRADGSVMREHLGQQVFDRRLGLRDDATDVEGLAFPFDLEGTLKRPIDLVVDGKPSTPALDHRQAAIVGLSATGSAISGDDARAEHLVMLPGDADEKDLLLAAAGGIRLGWCERFELFDPGHARFRAVIRGVRRVDASGRLAEALPDLVWEDSLLHVLARLVAVGRHSTTMARGTFGGTRAPAFVIPEARSLRPQVA